MKKIVICRWIPASWKSTWALNEVENSGAIRFNKDDLRKEEWIFPAWYFYSKENEEIIYNEERDRVLQAIIKGSPYIIIDNTHLWKNNKHISFYRELAKSNWYEFIIKDFYCSREEAIKRDKLRWENQVWVDVIDRLIKIQWNWWYPLNPTFRDEELDIKKEQAFIVDIDWTLAFMDEKRLPFEFDKVDWDRCNIFLRDLLLTLSLAGNKILIVSWRWKECINETKKWIEDKHIKCDLLYMRELDDTRSDDIIKWEIYENDIEPYYSIQWVFDDRQKVVDMWRLKYKLPTYQVWYWNF